MGMVYDWFISIYNSINANESARFTFPIIAGVFLAGLGIWLIASVIMEFRSQSSGETNVKATVLLLMIGAYLLVQAVFLFARSLGF